MVQYRTLDESIGALADPTRRGILELLARGDRSITELAEAFAMTLTGMKKHVAILEEAGLVATAKVGRVRTCSLGPRRLDDVSKWVESYQAMWEARFNALDNLLERMKGN